MYSALKGAVGRSGVRGAVALVAAGLLCVIAGRGADGPSSPARATAPSSRAGATAPAAPATASRPAQVVLKGVVLDEADKPLAETKVSVYALAPRRYVHLSDKVRLLSEAAVGGGFAFPVSVEYDAMLVVAEKEGFGIAWQIWTPRGGQITMTLGPASVLGGTVVDQGGLPVGGARVSLSLRPPRRARSGWWLEGRDGIGSLLARTDAEGRFAFTNVPHDAVGAFQVQAPGHAILSTQDMRGSGEFAAPARDIRLAMAPEGRVETTVIDKATSRPVGNLALVAEGRGAPPQEGTCTQPARGGYVFSGLPAGSYNICLAVNSDDPGEWAAAPVMVEAKAGQTVASPNLEVVRGGLAEIAIRDAEDGKAVPRAYVSTWNTKGRGAGAAWTGNDGVARLRLLPGEYRIGLVSAAGYGASSEHRTITVSEDHTSRLDVKLNKIPRAHGVVVDASGAAAPGTLLCLLPSEQYTPADSAGKFELEREPYQWSYPGNPLLVGRNPQANLAAAMDIKDLAKPVELRLQPAWTVAGRVVDPQGKPIAGAALSVQVGTSYPRVLAPVAKKVTGSGAEFEISALRVVFVLVGEHAGSGGEFEISALPPGQTYALRAKAKGYGTSDAALDFAQARNNRLEAPDLVLCPVDLKAPAPAVRAIDIPEIPGQWAVWGATGRDSRGHIWFSVTAHEINQPSAHLFELTPRTGQLIDRGDVVGQLKQAGVCRAGEGQMKIHTKMFQAADGNLYFASMDEEGEEEAGERPPTWGSHLWRLHLQDGRWEHLLAAPEGLVAAWGSGKLIYALGYWQHVLYQYDIAKGQSRSVKVGSIGGHVSRNILVDGNGHAYVPRIRTGQDGLPSAALVEFDTDLKEIGQTPLRYYFSGRPADAHGITGFVHQPDGSIVFLTHNGFLSVVRPSAQGPAKVSDIGWFHPDGPTYCASLFGEPSGRRIMGAAAGNWSREPEWVVCDLKTGVRSTAPLKVSSPRDLALHGALLYGSETRDDEGNCYVVGAAWLGMGRGHRPLVLQVRPPAPSTTGPSKGER